MNLIITRLSVIAAGFTKTAVQKFSYLCKGLKIERARGSRSQLVLILVKASLGPYIRIALQGIRHMGPGTRTRDHCGILVERIFYFAIGLVYAFYFKSLLPVLRVQQTPSP
jgi:hypothetical protein